MKYVCGVFSVLFWVALIPSFSPSTAGGAEASSSESCQCPKLACDVCSVERGITFYSEKCGDKKSKVKSCGRPTCIPIEQATAACPVPPKAGSGPSEPVVIRAPAVPVEAAPAQPAVLSVGHVRVIQGSVSIVHSNGKKVQVTKDTSIQEKDTIESGKDGKAVVEFEGGNKLHVHPDTAVEVNEFKDQASDSRKALLKLIKGKIRNQVNQKYNGKSSYYRVQTKAVVAGVRGTDFVMENHEDGSVETKIETLGGKVVFSRLDDDSQIREISRGEGASFLADEPGTRGTLTPVYKLSSERLQKLDVESSVEVAARQSQHKSESAICENPRGLYNQCSWGRTKTGDNCIRSRCNANGVWAEPTPMPAASGQSPCPASGFTVKDCDY